MPVALPSGCAIGINTAAPLLLARIPLPEEALDPTLPLAHPQAVIARDPRPDEEVKAFRKENNIQVGDVPSYGAGMVRGSCEQAGRG